LTRSARVGSPCLFCTTGSCRPVCGVRAFLIEGKNLDKLHEIACSKSITRRDLLRAAVVAGASSPVHALRPLKAALTRNPASKVVVATFGGGARDEETFAPEGHENIPHLLSELIPQSTFCTQVINRGILGHYVATASLATGAYETFNNFADVSPANPTVFEYFRKGLGRPAQDAWVIAPSNGFNRIGQSESNQFAPGYGAAVLLPKHLLRAALGSKSTGQPGLAYLHQDNYEDPFYVSPLIHEELHLERLDKVLKLAVDNFVKDAQALASADELSVYIMRQLMRQVAPSLLWVTLHDMDVAHTGSYSLYLDGIRRSDRLCAEIWNFIQSEPEYKDKTTLFILPDFGRDSDFDASGNGFQHHRTGDPISRTTWIMALGPHIRQNVIVDRPLDSLDLVPTLGALMDFSTPYAHGTPISEVL
jgi:hypothetical protein